MYFGSFSVFLCDYIYYVIPSLLETDCGYKNYNWRRTQKHQGCRIQAKEKTVYYCSEIFSAIQYGTSSSCAIHIFGNFGGELQKIYGISKLYHKYITFCSMGSQFQKSMNNHQSFSSANLGKDRMLRRNTTCWK